MECPGDRHSAGKADPDAAGPARYSSRHGARHERCRQAPGSYPSPVSVSTGGALSQLAG